MTDEPSYAQLLASKGVSLQQLGLDDIALPRADALIALELLQQQSVPILGGDVYVVRGDRTELAHANWHSDPRADESRADYVARSCQDARTYIAAYPHRDGETPVFVIVV